MAVGDTRARSSRLGELPLRPAPRDPGAPLDREPVGLNRHSVEAALLEFQRPEVGDTIGLRANRIRLESVDPQDALAWRSEDGNWV
jgi:hypothetical protein